MDNWEIKLTNLAYSAIENAEYPQNIKIDKHIGSCKYIVKNVKCDTFPL